MILLRFLITLFELCGVSNVGVNVEILSFLSLKLYTIKLIILYLLKLRLLLLKRAGGQTNAVKLFRTRKNQRVQKRKSTAVAGCYFGQGV